MKVTLERKGPNHRAVHILENAEYQQPDSITEIIEMLRIARDWLEEGKRKREATKAP